MKRKEENRKEKRKEKKGKEEKRKQNKTEQKERKTLSTAGTRRYGALVFHLFEHCCEDRGPFN